MPSEGSRGLKCYGNARLSLNTFIIWSMYDAAPFIHNTFVALSIAKHFP